MNAFSAIRQSSNDPNDSKVVKLLGTSESPHEAKIEQQFQLDRRPFSSIPDIEEYFAASTIENARSSIIRQVLREEGPALVVGPVGVGKTLLSHLLENTLLTHCRVIQMTSGRLSSRRALLQVMLYELGLSYHDLDEGEARLALIDHVTNPELCPEGILLLVDEAENLRMSLLDELRMMTNLMSHHHPCIRLVLIGDRRLEEKFAHPRLESFNQRITGRYYLDRLSKEEVRGYVRAIVIRAGGDVEKLYTEQAYTAIYQATEGIPRLINQLCAHAFILGAARGTQRIDETSIAEAWANLQQLPLPQTTHYADSECSESAVVEFGQLDEFVDSSPPADSALPPTDEQPETAAIPSQGKLADIPEHLIVADALEVSDEADLKTTATESLDKAPVFHDAHSTLDPFQEHFAEEEVVIDNFLKPNVLADRHPAVTCEESRQIIEHLPNMLRHASDEPIPEPIENSNDFISESDSDLEETDEFDDDVELNLITFIGPADDETEMVPQSEDLNTDSEDWSVPEATLEGMDQDLKAEVPGLTEANSSCEEDDRETDRAEEMQTIPENPEATSAESDSCNDGQDSDAQASTTTSNKAHYRNLFTRLRKSS